MHKKISPSRYSNVLYQSDLVTIGRFHLPANSADFQTAGAIARPTLVFPRTQAWIEKQNKRRYLSHPNLINFYNARQHYVRYQMHHDNDSCDWFEFSAQALGQAFAVATQKEVDEEYKCRSESDFSFETDHAFCNPQVYLQQRFLVESIRTGNLSGEGIQIKCLELLERVFNSRFDSETLESLPLQKRLRYQDITVKAEELILTNLNQNMDLDNLASMLGVSPFHLCRIFKLINGVSILEFKIQARLRFSLHELTTSRDIAELALNHGFSSHSHYSTKFKKVFGCTPARFRKSLA